MTHDAHASVATGLVAPRVTAIRVADDLGREVHELLGQPALPQIFGFDRMLISVDEMSAHTNAFQMPFVTPRAAIAARRVCTLHQLPYSGMTVS